MKQTKYWLVIFLNLFPLFCNADALSGIGLLFYDIPSYFVYSCVIFSSLTFIKYFDTRERRFLKYSIFLIIPALVVGTYCFFMGQDLEMHYEQYGSTDARDSANTMLGAAYLSFIGGIFILGIGPWLKQSSKK